MQEHLQAVLPSQEVFSLGKPWLKQCNSLCKATQADIQSRTLPFLRLLALNSVIFHGLPLHSPRFFLNALFLCVSFREVLVTGKNFAV